MFRSIVTETGVFPNREFASAKSSRFGWAAHPINLESTKQRTRAKANLRFFINESDPEINGQNQQNQSDQQADSTIELTLLMEYSPISLDERLRAGILDYDREYSKANNIPRRFESYNDETYSLLYKGTPVLLAHSLNWQRLYNAMIDYQAGVKFYCSCYPEQVKYIKKIMPDVEFI